MIKLTGNLHKNQRVAVFVDVQNLYYSAKHLYKARLNFETILKNALRERQLVRAFAYVVKADFDYEKHFFEMLERIGFEVRVKELQIFYGGNKKGDWDVGLSMDMVRMADKVDTCVLVSGDGDYKDLLEFVQARGCRAEVMAFGRSASIKLKETADMFWDMDINYRIYIQPEPKKFFRENVASHFQKPAQSQQLPILNLNEKKEIALPEQKEELKPVIAEEIKTEQEETLHKEEKKSVKKKEKEEKKDKKTPKKKSLVKSIFKKKR